MTEYILIVFLIGVGTVGLVGLFGDNIRGLFGASSESLAGAPDVDNPGSTTNNPKWTLKGGSLSTYGASTPGFAPAGGPGIPGGGSVPGGSAGSMNPGSNPGGSLGAF